MPLLYIPAIHRITHRIGLSIAAALDVSQGEAHILAHLTSNGPCTIAALHRALAHKRSTLTSILDRLAERRWILRQPSDVDRRSFVIALTRTGTTHARKALRHLEMLEHGFDKQLTPAESLQLAELLAKLSAY